MPTKVNNEKLDVLMGRLQRGDASALEDIYRITYENLYRLSYAILRCFGSAKDIVQDVFVQLFHVAKQYKLGTNANAWICRIARNKCYDEYKRRGKTDVFEETTLDILQTPKCGEDKWMTNIMLQTALDKLDVDTREIVVLFGLKQYKHYEIAEIVGKPTGTVKWLYQKALKEMKKILQGGG